MHMPEYFDPVYTWHLYIGHYDVVDGGIEFALGHQPRRDRLDFVAVPAQCYLEGGANPFFVVTHENVAHYLCLPAALCALSGTTRGRTCTEVADSCSTAS